MQIIYISDPVVFLVQIRQLHIESRLPPNCTVLNFGTTVSIVKLYWETTRQMEFLQVSEHYILLLV